MSEIYFNNLEFGTLSILWIKPGVNNRCSRVVPMQVYYTVLFSLEYVFHKLFIIKSKHTNKKENKKQIYSKQFNVLSFMVIILKDALVRIFHKLMTIRFLENNIIFKYLKILTKVTPCLTLFFPQIELADNIIPPNRTS